MEYGQMGMTAQARKARIRELIEKYPEPWVVEKEAHDYNDGTHEFTHVGFTRMMGGESFNVRIGSHVTPDLAELLILLRESAEDIHPDDEGLGKEIPF